MPPPHSNPRNLSLETHGHHHHHSNPPPSPPWTHIWPIIKTPPPYTTTTATPNSTTMNPQKKSIPKSNQTNSKFRIHKMTHKKKIKSKFTQTQLQTDLAVANHAENPWTRRRKPPYHAAAYPWTQKTYPKIPRNRHHTTSIWLPNLTSTSNPRRTPKKPTVRERRDEKEKLLWWERDVMREPLWREEWEEKQSERKSQKMGNKQIL